MFSLLLIIVTVQSLRVETVQSLPADAVQSVPVEKLLQSTISSAQCHARCLPLSSPSDQKDCLTICSTVQSHPATSLCRYPPLCTGGCQTACQGPVTTATSYKHRKLSNLVQQSCQLSWQLEKERNKNVVFVLEGKDRIGMWSLISNKVYNITYFRSYFDLVYNV